MVGGVEVPLFEVEHFKVGDCVELRSTGEHGVVRYFSGLASRIGRGSLVYTFVVEFPSGRRQRCLGSELRAA